EENKIIKIYIILAMYGLILTGLSTTICYIYTKSIINIELKNKYNITNEQLNKAKILEDSIISLKEHLKFIPRDIADYPINIFVKRNGLRGTEYYLLRKEFIPENLLRTYRINVEKRIEELEKFNYKTK
ncbi:MAG: hypothetical protein RRY36_08175, partial [Bacteroidaceae bacterium]